MLILKSSSFFVFHFLPCLFFFSFFYTERVIYARMIKSGIQNEDAKPRVKGSAFFILEFLLHVRRGIFL